MGTLIAVGNSSYLIGLIGSSRFAIYLLREDFLNATNLSILFVELVSPESVDERHCIHIDVLTHDFRLEQVSRDQLHELTRICAPGKSIPKLSKVMIRF